MLSFRKKRFISIKVVTFMVAISLAFPLHVINPNGERICTVDDIHATDLVDDVKEKIRRRTKLQDFHLVSQGGDLLNENDGSNLEDFGITMEADLTFVKNSDAIYSYEPNISNEEKQIALREEEKLMQFIEGTYLWCTGIGGFGFPIVYMIWSLLNAPSTFPGRSLLEGEIYTMGSSLLGAFVGAIFGAMIRSIAKRKISVISFQEGSENWIIKVPVYQRRLMRALKRSDLERRMRSWRNSQRHPTGYWFYEIEELSMEQILDLVFPTNEGYEHKKYRSRKCRRCMRSYQHWNKRKIITYLQVVCPRAPANDYANELAWGLLDV